MASSEIFHCSVVTPERAVLECEAKFVALPAWDGEVGILKGRAPLLCKLGIGRLRIETADGKQILFVDGGFAEMLDNQLTILTENARTPEEIDRQAVNADLDTARGLTVTDDASFEARQKALQRARTQLRLAE
ncbi:MAG: ATP synthase F1 subunit epsilon [Thermoanaerobaculia bacterium]|jgi:F-type H+-transporting ATPase subunit epsilon